MWTILYNINTLLLLLETKGERNHKPHCLSCLLSNFFCSFLVSCARISKNEWWPSTRIILHILTFFLFFCCPSEKWQTIAITEAERRGWTALTLSPLLACSLVASNRLPLQTRVDGKLLLLLSDTHAGGNLTDYSFKSHLSTGHQRLHVQ